MTPPDLEITVNPGQVWRVGFKPDPWAWTGWAYATDEGRFNGRWDDQMADFRTLYSGESLLACLLEVLAQFRPDPATVAELDEIEDPDGQIELHPAAAAGTVGYGLLEERIAGSALQGGRFCFVTHSASLAAIRARFPFTKFGLPPQDLDAALLKNGSARTLTRSIARWLYELRDADNDDLVDGVEFRSRFGDELRMWAVFERLHDQFLTTSQRFQNATTITLSPELPEIRQAFELHGLRWPD